jgi:hypothetical protein
MFSTFLVTIKLSFITYYAPGSEKILKAKEILFALSFPNLIEENDV